MILSNLRYVPSVFRTLSSRRAVALHRRRVLSSRNKVAARMMLDFVLVTAGPGHFIRSFNVYSTVDRSPVLSHTRFRAA